MGQAVGIEEEVEILEASILNEIIWLRVKAGPFEIFFKNVDGEPVKIRANRPDRKVIYDPMDGVISSYLAREATRKARWFLSNRVLEK